MWLLSLENATHVTPCECARSNFRKHWPVVTFHTCSNSGDVCHVCVYVCACAHVRVCVRESSKQAKGTKQEGGKGPALTLIFPVCDADASISLSRVNASARTAESIIMTCSSSWYLRSLRSFPLRGFHT